MAHGPVAKYAYIVNENEMRKLSPEISELLDKILAHENLIDFALGIHDEGYCKENFPDLWELYSKLAYEFYKATSLNISIGYHVRGDIFDDIDDETCFWYVVEYDLFKPTEAGIKYYKLGNLIEKLHFIEQNPFRCNVEYV